MRYSKIGVRRSILLTLPCLIFLIPDVSAQSRSTITGIVFDQDRRPVARIPVELMNEYNSVLQRTKTEGSGRYVFSGVGSGRFTVRVLPLGTNLEEQTQEVEIFGISADGRRTLADNVQLDFTLRSRRANRDVLGLKGTVFAQDVPETARKLYESAVVDLDAERIDAGVVALQEALKIFPTYYDALARLGLVSIAKQDFPSAKMAFGSAVTINPRSFQAWYGLSYASLALNEPSEAILSAQKALELEKNSVNALFVLGVSQRRVKNYQEAEKAFVRAKKLDEGKTPDICWNLALLYYHNLKRHREAAEELENYLKINPDAPNKEAVKKLIKQFREAPPA